MSNVIDFHEYRARQQRRKARHIQGTVAAFNRVAFIAMGEVIDRDFDSDESEFAYAIESVAQAMTTE